MSAGDRHEFRFFVEEPCVGGAAAVLAAVDLEHLRVLRMDDGASVELVAPDGSIWSAHVASGRVICDALRSAPGVEPQIELVAGALVGGKFDELVDGAVQAGATSITPFATRRSDAERLGARSARLQRIARAAAKQAKRMAVPTIHTPIDVAALVAGPAGIIVDPAAPQPLDLIVEQVTREAEAGPLRLLVGSADGIDSQLTEQLVERGWRRGRLGTTILRAELAAPVAVAIAAMHAHRPTR